MRPSAFGLVLLVFYGMVNACCTVEAGHGCCAHCGCHDSCQKVCRLVCEEKLIEVVCWGVKCEDFCVPGPSCPKCKYCEEVCGECDEAAAKAGVCPLHKSFVWRSWCANPCGTIYTKKKLMKKIVKHKVPTYKWVVEDLCQHCEAAAPAASVQAGVDVPDPPVEDAKLKVGPPMPAPPAAP